MAKASVKLNVNMVRAIAIVVFVVVVLAVVIGSIAGLRQPAVAVCVLVVIEALIAALLHRAELWIHGVLILAEIIVGILFNHIVLVILCLCVYVAATAVMMVLEQVTGK